MTYSILGVDPVGGEIGVAVQSHFFAVGSRAVWARPGVGAVATQSIVEPAYGLGGLALMERGWTPDRALARLLADDERAATRQVALLAVSGAGATHTGSDCIGFAGHAVSAHCRAQANLVVSNTVWTAMVAEFETAAGSLAERLLAALQRAQQLGGDLRGQQAAALVVVRTEPRGDLNDDVVVDLRVDDSDHPLDELARLLSISHGPRDLLRLLQTDGLFTGEFAAAPHAVTAAVETLDRAQALGGPDNTEPTVWKGLLLARAGRPDEARTCFAEARQATPRIVELLRRLAEAGMWTRDPAELEALLTTDDTPASR